MVGRAASVVSPFYSLLHEFALWSNSKSIDWTAWTALVYDKWEEINWKEQIPSMFQYHISNIYNLSEDTGDRGYIEY